MEQLEFFEIPSPCINVCESNERGYCKGCFRSREERLYWLKLSDAQKREVVRLCQQRRRKIWQAKLYSQAAAESVVMDEPELLFDMKDKQE